jgi:hypothetical protein
MLILVSIQVLLSSFERLPAILKLGPVVLRGSLPLLSPTVFHPEPTEESQHSLIFANIDLPVEKVGVDCFVRRVVLRHDAECHFTP